LKTARTYKPFFLQKKKEKKKNQGLYFFFKYGKLVLLFTPTAYPFGKSQGVPLFGDRLLKK
jgi:hypothetical protein